jgi:hypothetical protein
MVLEQRKAPVVAGAFFDFCIYYSGLSETNTPRYVIDWYWFRWFGGLTRKQGVGKNKQNQGQRQRHEIGTLRPVFWGGSREDTATAVRARKNRLSGGAAG